jgi:hypothetical protein
MTRLAFPAFTLVAGLSISACAGHSPGSPRPNATVITQAEIVDAGSSDAYLLVQKLRPVWLQKRGSTSFSQEGDIVVYLDATSLGGRETLRNITTDEIESIQFLDARRATLRFGSGHVNGAIVITARR